MGWERIELTRLRVDEFQSPGNFIDELILASLGEAFRKAPL